MEIPGKLRKEGGGWKYLELNGFTRQKSNLKSCNSCWRRSTRTLRKCFGKV